MSNIFADAINNRLWAYNVNPEENLYKQNDVVCFFKKMLYDD